MTPRTLVTLPARRRMAAFSLVELMVALTLSLLLMGGALSILYSTKLTSAENERIARIQEAGRTAFELIRQDARGAGYVGCARPHTNSAGFTNYNSANLNNTTLLWDFSKPVYGFHASGSTWNPALDPAIPASPQPVTGSDVLVLRTTRPGSPVFRTNVAATGGTADISVDRDASVSLRTPTPMIIGDCRYAEVFIASGWTPSGATASILHAAGGAPVGNTTNSLTVPLTIPYRQGALLQPVQTVIYYVASCVAISGPCTTLTPPALWQIVGLDTPGGAQPQELIQGVEAMQLKFGVDTDQDLLVNKYYTADTVPNWNSVIGINLAILVGSNDQTGVSTDQQTYSLLGTPFGPYNDRRNRKVFTTTITFRNDTT
jgi:type IV pilus assembly protein PilW